MLGRREGEIVSRQEIPSQWERVDSPVKLLIGLLHSNSLVLPPPPLTDPL